MAYAQWFSVYLEPTSNNNNNNSGEESDDDFNMAVTV